MAESVVIVCDVCGDSPADTVGIRLKDRNLVKDLCSLHLGDLVKGARPPKRGRPARTSPPARAATPARPRSARSSATRPAPKKALAAKRARRKIMDPGTLEKRRAALQKARQALAAKRASQKKAG
jgi:hypothetical protein